MESRKGNNSRLAQYYGLESKQLDSISETPPIKASSTTAKQSGKNPSLNPTCEKLRQETVIDSPLELDSKFFDYRLFFDQVLSQKGLQDLNEFADVVSSDVRKYETEKKTLVYENYAKFINATETIKSMKKNVEKMENEMSNLLSDLSAITSGSSDIHKRFSNRRSEITKMHETNIMLKKIQFLFELPVLLRSNVQKRQQWKQTMRHYDRTIDVFDIYSQVPTFHKIRKECEEIVLPIRNELRERIKTPQKIGDLQELFDTTSILICLRESFEFCSENFAAVGKSILKGLLSTKWEDRESESLSEVLKVMEKKILWPITLTIAHFEYFFLPDPESQKYDTGRSPSGQQLIIDFSALKKAKHGKKDETIKAEQELNKGLYALLDGYFELVTSRVFGKIKAVSMEDTKALVSLIDQLQAQVIDVGDYIRQDTSIRLQKITIKSLEKYISDKFNNIKSLIYAKWATLDLQYDSAKTFNAPEIIQVSSLIRDSLLDSITVFKGFNNGSNAVLALENEISKICVSQLQSFFPEMQSEVFFKGGDNLFLRNLFSSKICETLADSEGLTEYFDKFNETLIPNNGRREWVSVTKKICSYLKNESQRLWQESIELKAFDLTLLVRKTIEGRDWISVKEPKRVSKIWIMIEEELVAIDRLTSQVYKSTEKMTPPSTISSEKKSSSHKSKATTSDPLGYNLDRIFTEKLVLYEKLPLSHMKANTFITKIIIKAFLESVRSKTFGTFGFQQIQLDREWIKGHFWKFMDKPKILEFLMDEVLESCAKRCLSYKPLDSNILEKLLESREQTT